MLVSHDRWMLDRVATSILAFEENGRLDLHIGGYSEYRERRRGADRDGSPMDLSVGAVPSNSRPSVKVNDAKRLSASEQRELDGLPDGIEAIEQKVTEIQLALADPGLYEKSAEVGAELRSTLNQAVAEAARLNARWEELEERKAAAESGQFS